MVDGVDVCPFWSPLPLLGLRGLGFRVVLQGARFLFPPADGQRYAVCCTLALTD